MNLGKKINNTPKEITLTASQTTAKQHTTEEHT